MLDVLGWLIEGAIELVGDLLESGADAATDAAAETAAAPLAAPMPAPLFDAGGFGEQSWWGGQDGGISPRFDPPPVAGPYTPGV